MVLNAKPPDGPPGMTQFGHFVWALKTIHFYKEGLNQIDTFWLRKHPPTFRGWFRLTQSLGLAYKVGSWVGGSYGPNCCCLLGLE